MTPIPQPRISLVIATFNGATRIGTTLHSLLTQSLSSELWEAVVVNNNSTDSTADVVREFMAAHPEITIVPTEEPRQGLSYARNRGIEVARGEIIAIIDDDEIASPQLLADYLHFFDTHPEAVAAGGRIVPLYANGRPEWMSRHTERPIAGTLDLGDRVIPFPEGKYFGGGNMALRRSAIEKYGAFNPALGRRGTTLLGGEEKELYARLYDAGEKIFYIPTAYIQHIIPESKLTRDYFERVCFRIGQSERAATIVLGAYHILTLHPARAKYLWIMRRQISRGLATEPTK